VENGDKESDASVLESLTSEHSLNYTDRKTRQCNLDYRSKSQTIFIIFVLVETANEFSIAPQPRRERIQPTAEVKLKQRGLSMGHLARAQQLLRWATV